MSNNKVLFILKRRPDYNAATHSHIGMSTGLYNSANFMNQMLIDSGIESNLFVAIDNNCIDREVTKHRPTHVIIEALWVVPSKFTILCKLHPKVKWIIRLHSETPFLAGEGNAFDWIGDYVDFPNLYIGINAPRALLDVQTFLKISKGWDNEKLNEKVFYMPNYYPQNYKTKEHNFNKDTIDIGCFGAVRPLKNHMIQAIASIRFANTIGKKLRFHINSGRIEMKGEPVLNNLKGMFGHLFDEDHQLINDSWRPREEFLKLCETMDIGLQCSFSETFNIVGADLVSVGVPLIGSVEIPWLKSSQCADPTSSDDIYNKLLTIYKDPTDNVLSNQFKLKKYTNKTKKIWLDKFK